MKRNITLGTLLFGAIVLSSCATTKIASTKNSDDDVYYSEAKTKDLPEYAPTPIYRDESESSDGYQDDYYTTDENYSEYDDYSSRINRFAYASPFGYYDNLYYGYGGYGGGFYSGLGWGGGYGYGGWGLGIGYGWGGYGYSPFGYGGYYGGGYGYGGYGYSYLGTGYYGGSPYWGIYSANRAVNPRPYRGSGIPERGYRPGSVAGRPSSTGYRPDYSGRPASVGYGRRPTPADSRSSGNARPTSAGTSRPRESSTETSRPSYNPQPSYTPAPSSSGSGRSGGSSAGSSSSGGGGGRSSGSGGRGRN